MAARKAIGDSGREQALIRTVRGRGYQFVAEAEEAGDEASTPAASESIPGRTGLEGSETRYASSGKLSIAYRTFGSGPPDIIIAPGSPTSTRSPAPATSRGSFASWRGSRA